MDELTMAARAEATRFMLSEATAFRDEMLEDASGREAHELSEEMLHKHLVVHATPRGHAVAILTLPNTVNLALDVWIATVQAKERHGGIAFERELVRLTSVDDVLRALIPALRDFFTKQRNHPDQYGASLYVNAALGTMTPSHVERLRQIAREDGEA